MMSRVDGQKWRSGGHAHICGEQTPGIVVELVRPEEIKMMEIIEGERNGKGE